MADPPEREERDPDVAVAALAAAAPGPGLAGALAALDPEAVTDEVLVEVVAAWSRIGSWAHAQAARWAGVLSTRPAMNPTWSPAAGGTPARPCVAGDELAMRLAVSRRAAETLVAEGRAFDGPLAATGEALATGRIDPARAHALVGRLAPLPLVVALAVEDRVLPGAESRTVSQLRRDVERALVEVDGLHAADRHRRARTARRVDHARLLPDGMAGLWCVLPAADAARVDGTLDSVARTGRAAGDPRTLDQLRADVLRDLVLRQDGCAHRTGTCAGICAGSSGNPDPSVTGGLGARTSGGPGRGPGAGRGPAPGAVPVPVPGAGSAPGADAGPAPAPAPGAGSAPGADAGPVLVPVPGAGEADVPGAGGDGDLGPARAGCTGRCRTVPAPARIDVQVTVSLATLLGLDDAPGRIAGLGPVDATQARALAAGGLWRRIVTDPLSGAVLDVGRTRYRPTAAMIDHVRARDVRCARPGCDVDARRADLDHTVEFRPPPHGRHEPGRGDEVDGGPGSGTTGVGNLGPLCRRDHRLKTDGGFVLRQPEPGVFEWVTPAGHRYRVRPGADAGYQHVLPESEGSACAGSPPRGTDRAAGTGRPPRDAGRVVDADGPPPY